MPYDVPTQRTASVIRRYAIDRKPNLVYTHAYLYRMKASDIDSIMGWKAGSAADYMRTQGWPVLGEGPGHTPRGFFEDLMDAQNIVASAIAPRPTDPISEPMLVAEPFTISEPISEPISETEPDKILYALGIGLVTLLFL